MRKHSPLLAVLLLAVLWCCGAAAWATYYLEIAESDTNYANFTQVYRRVNAAFGYPKPGSLTTRAVLRYTKSSPSPSSMISWEEREDAIVRNGLTTPEKAAIVTSDPGGYTLNMTYSQYFNEFDAAKSGQDAFALDGDSVMYSANGDYALTEPERLYYKINALLPSGAQAINFAIGGRDLTTLNSEFATKIGSLNWPEGATKNLVIYSHSNDIVGGGQNGYVAAARLQTYITTAKNAIPGLRVWVATPMARTSNSYMGAIKDFYIQTKAYANLEGKGYKLIDLGADPRGNTMTNVNAALNTEFWQDDHEHPKGDKGTDYLAHAIVDALYPPAGIHPVVLACGRMWRETIPEGATYTTITQGNGIGNGIRSGAADGLPNYYDDPNPIITAHNSDPVRDLIFPAGFGPGRPSGTTQAPMDIRVPASAIIPDVLISNTYNYPGAVYNEDTGAVWFFNTMCRPSSTSALWAYYNCDHAGGGINAPPIMKYELDQGHIDHALPINLPGGYLYWTSGTSSGWTPPATTNDGGASGATYTGTQSILTMGSHLALPPEVTAESLGITNPDSIAVIDALHTRGAYVVDTISTGYSWHTYSWGVEWTIEGRLSHTDMEKIGRALKVVTY